MRKCPSLWIIVVKKLYSEKINKRGRGWPILKKNLTTLSIVLPIQQSILSYVFYALGHYESLTRAKVLYPPRPFPCWDVGITFWICWQIWISVFPHSEFFVVPLGLRVILKSSFCTFEVLSWLAVSGYFLFDPTAPIWSLTFSENKPRKTWSVTITSTAGATDMVSHLGSPWVRILLEQSTMTRWDHGRPL